MKKFGLILLIVVLALSAVLAQRRGGRGRGRAYAESYRTPREMAQHSVETPVWTNSAGYERDTFTFVRILRSHNGGYGGNWDTDTPDSDLNLSYRLQQVTSMRVDPDGLFLRLTDEDLADYPLIYMVEPGTLYLTDEEVEALRKYLLNGGFLFLDDFWGDTEWESLEREMKKVFPDRDFVELPLTHPLYHCVFDIKSKGQCPNIDNGNGHLVNPDYPTWEKGPTGREVHHRVIFDDKGRIMAFAAHNTDNGDGWEWEGNNHGYFEHFAEKIAYPLAINVIFYTMTH
jgi:uncharacterized protein DUF4159